MGESVQNWGTFTDTRGAAGEEANFWSNAAVDVASEKALQQEGVAFKVKGGKTALK